MQRYVESVERETVYTLGRRDENKDTNVGLVGIYSVMLLEERRYMILSSMQSCGMNGATRDKHMRIYLMTMVYHKEQYKED